ncbi:hypothetical protein M422DRAFT_35073 [Sphaerobolus stellatus SS14]|uniref:Uncharacterized protein n=1 Tax=Sphaerobolus stellatus (strain SS14) TaxID=990650 RepID=A0A0C9VAQ7_SPHS4|nr:hypothetical protein M422DRAFT_39549 [Sphaerobolus stellatus SS14]KIJ34575.1 hypothetical protein M422DRAFT_35073 [Sphaerobolus stellatus SS14]
MDYWTMEEAEGFYGKFASLIIGDRSRMPSSQLERVLHVARTLRKYARQRNSGITFVQKSFASSTRPVTKIAASGGPLTTTCSRIQEPERATTGEMGEALVNAVAVIRNGKGLGEMNAVKTLQRHCEDFEDDFEE